MFTGLIQQISKVKEIHPNKEGKTFTIEFKGADKQIKIDDSVAVNGVCQTATQINGDLVTFQAVHTTLEKTTLGNLKPNDVVNTELALRASDRLGGHMVQGHVNGFGKISEIRNLGQNYMLSVSYPKELGRYFVAEGSVAIDGISLTIAEHQMDECVFTLSIIPHTWANTILQHRQVGDLVNIEVDILAKYVENMLNYANKQNPESKITMNWLSEQGF
ncbi:MAG: riboflavin synthase [Deltaproteobacteria bacterium]|nr:MAG: riboflavin synthase [Deltaproteobacteria bacterium]